MAKCLALAGGSKPPEDTTMKTKLMQITIVEDGQPIVERAFRSVDTTKPGTEFVVPWLYRRKRLHAGDAETVSEESLSPGVCWQELGDDE